MYPGVDPKDMAKWPGCVGEKRGGGMEIPLTPYQSAVPWLWLTLDLRLQLPRTAGDGQRVARLHCNGQRQQWKDIMNNSMR